MTRALLAAACAVVLAYGLDGQKAALATGALALPFLMLALVRSR